MSRSDKYRELIALPACELARKAAGAPVLDTMLAAEAEAEIARGEADYAKGDRFYDRFRVEGPAVLNAANEVAVEAFLAGRIGWQAIADVANGVLQGHDGGPANTVEDIIAADSSARSLARQHIEKRQ